MVNQLWRDFITVLIIIGCFLFFVSSLNLYLSVLSNPKPFLFSLLFTLGLSIFYELKPAVNSTALVGVLSVLVVFCLGVFLAEYIREMYLYVLEGLKDLSEEEKNHIGYEYVRAVENPAVGIGASYAAGIAIFRITTFNFIKNLFSKLLITDFNPLKCQQCGSIVKEK